MKRAILLAAALALGLVLPAQAANKLWSWRQRQQRHMLGHAAIPAIDWRDLLARIAGGQLWLRASDGQFYALTTINDAGFNTVSVAQTPSTPPVNGADYVVVAAGASAWQIGLVNDAGQITLQTTPYSGALPVYAALSLTADSAPQIGLQTDGEFTTWITYQ